MIYDSNDKFLDRLVQVLGPLNGHQRIATLLQEKLSQNDGCPLIAVGETMIGCDRLHKSCSLARDTSMVSGIRSANSRQDVIDVLDSGSAAGAKCSSVRTQRIGQRDAIVASTAWQGASWPRHISSQHGPSQRPTMALSSRSEVSRPACARTSALRRVHLSCCQRWWVRSFSFPSGLPGITQVGGSLNGR